MTPIGSPAQPLPEQLGMHVLSAMREGVLVTGLDGRMVFANDAAHEILGLTPEELADRTAADPRWVAVDADGFPRAPGDLPSARTTRTGEECRREPVGVLRPDGAVRWLEVTTTRLPDDGGTLSTFADTTEQRDESRALRLAEERFRRTFDHGPIGKALVDVDGTWLRVNRKLGELLGRSDEELLALTFGDITHPDDVDADAVLLRETIEGLRDDYEIEKRFVRSDGELLSGLLSVSLVRDDRGTPLHVVAQIQDISQRKRFEADLAHLADHDVLTGLRNRRRFEADLEMEIARIGRHAGPASLVMLDLDRFKEINDSLGHRVGDELLQHVARVLEARLRSTDVLARLGGDEFAILLPETTTARAEGVVLELVRRVAEQTVPVGYEADPVRVTISAGIAPIDSSHASADEAMVAADLAMYEAKHAGRNHVHVRSPDDQHEERERTRMAWSQRIRRALHDDGFVLHYQPIEDLRTGTISMFEALLRLRGAPGEPLILPGRFLYLAARHGLLPAVDRWVLTHAVDELASGALGADARLSINVSGLSLGDGRLADLIEERIIATGVDPARLQFEITETTAIASLEHAERFCRRVHRLGGQVALDDFGSGFASFLNLKRLPYDTIKVDGEFVRSAGRGPQERLLVEALLDVGQRLDKHTVAEFVEDRATHDLLRELGADAAQGWFVGRPAPAAEALVAAGAFDAARALEVAAAAESA